MSAFRPYVLLLCFNIESYVTQSPPFFEWQYALWSKHNEIRSQVATGSVESQPFATDMEQILYESNMEQVSLQHALRCNYTRNSDLEDEMKSISDQLSFKTSTFEAFGENIAYFEVSNTPFLNPTQLEDAIEEQWFKPHVYDYFTHQCDSDTGDSDCIAYQRLLWGRTRYMACGVSICPSLSFPEDHTVDRIQNAVFIVCDYWPSYDKDELPIYNTAALTDEDDIIDHMCTECAVDRSTQCTDGLCTGCPAPNYHYCQDHISVCDASAHVCNSDAVIQLYCPFTCYCSEQDWIPETECNHLYLDAPLHEECQRLGWFDVQQIESNASIIECEDGYSLPTMHNIDFVEENCLLSEDADLLDDIIPKAGTNYRPNGIAIGMIRYHMGCDWNAQYNDGVIPTHNGVKCGDRKQLFICIQDANTTAPTSAPTEGPTFSPTMEPTDDIFDTTVEVEVPITTEVHEPFRMYLIFPDESAKADGGNKHKDSRRLSSDNQPIQLFPLHGVSVSLPIENEVGFGYEFMLSHKVERDSEVGLSQIIYSIDAHECVDAMDDAGIKFQLFQQSGDEWMDIESIVYNVTRTDDLDNDWMNIVIDVEDYSLKFDVMYRFVIDVSWLRDNCHGLSHPIYGRTVGNFDIEKSDFIVKGLKGITSSTHDQNQSNLYKYWMNMSVKFA